MKKLLLCSVAASAIATGLPVLAADLPTKAPLYRPAPAPIRNWTGCYLGGNVGYGRAHNEYTGPTAPFLPARAPDQTIDGVAGGGQVGCDFQVDPFVVGIQGMGAWTSMSGTGDPYTLGKNLKASVPWLATVTGRVGYVIQPFLLAYVKGGVAWAHTDFDFMNGGVTNGTGGVTRTGWTVGGGLEWMFAPSWSVFAEYNRLDFGNRIETFSNIGGIASLNMNFKQNIDLVQLGVNYRF